MKALPLALTLGVMLLTAAIASPQNTPQLNVTGTWKIDAKKTNWGGGLAPDDLVWHIQESGNEIRIEARYTNDNNDPVVEKYVFDTSGKETVNRNLGMEVRTTLKRAGEELQEDSTASLPDGQTMTRRSWTTVGSDGKILTQKVEISGPEGAMKRTIVMRKQEQ